MSDTHMHDTNHRMAWSLIPWLVNGTIDEDDRRELESHLAGCDDCRGQYALERRIRDGLQAQREDGHDPQPALDDLMMRIDADHAVDTAAPRIGRGSGRRRWIRLLAAAAVVEAIGLAALGTALFDRAVLSPVHPELYRTLTTPSATASRATSGWYRQRR